MADAVAQIIGEKLSSRRKSLGLTVDALASISGVDSKLLLLIEAGQRRGHMTDLLKLCAALDLRLGELFHEFMNEADSPVDAEKAPPAESRRDNPAIDNTVVEFPLNHGSNNRLH